MAQDSSAPANANQEIDLDEIEVSILILAKNPNNLKQTCAFLSRRGWPATAMGNLSKAIEEIAEKRPDIVMVSFNHPSPAVFKLPELIAQTFNLICVGFVEGTDTASTSKLTTVKIRHKVFGTPSGPNFHRGIRRILAEKYNIKDEKEKAEERKSAGGGNVTIRGGKDEDDGDVLQESEGSQRGGSTTVVQGGSAGVGTRGIMQEGHGSANPMSAYQSSGSGPLSRAGGIGGPLGDEPDDATQNGDAVGSQLKARSGGNNLQAKMGETGAGLGAGGSGMGGDLSDAPDPDRELETTGKPQALGKIMQMGADGKKKGDTVVGKSGRKKLKDVTGEDKAKSAPGNMVLGENQDPAQAAAPVATENVQSDLVGMLKQSLFGEHAEDTTPLGLLEKAAEQALHQVCISNTEAKTAALNNVSHIGVFPIDSEALPGFLVIGLEARTAEDQKAFLKNCEDSLIATFATMKVPAKLQPGFWLDVPETSFQQWVETAGAFNFKLTHKGGEVGVSFFQTEKNLPKPSESFEKGMHTIDLSDISTTEPVTFKAYLYLKENKKFYLYLRNGRQLGEDQKERLVGNQMTQIFLKEVDLENLRMYLCAAYLKETIRTAKDAA